MKTLKITALLFIGLIANLAKADSPLTSTPFSTAYSANKYVKMANADGYYKKTEKALASKKTSSLDKLLIVNAIGWSKKDMAGGFETYLISKRKGLTKEAFKQLTTVSNETPVETAQTELLTADDLMTWSYLKAMSNYNEPALAIRGAFLAYSRDTKNMAYGVVLGLVAAQKAFDREWCDVYKTANQMIVENEYETNILSDEAEKIIMDYIGLYKSECSDL